MAFREPSEKDQPLELYQPFFLLIWSLRFVVVTYSQNEFGAANVVAQITRKVECGRIARLAENVHSLLSNQKESPGPQQLS